MKRNAWIFSTVLTISSLYLLLPFIIAFYVIVTQRPVLATGEYISPLSTAMDNLVMVFQRSNPWRALCNSFLIGFNSAAIGIALGFPVAYVLARYRFRYKTFLLGALLLLRLMPKMPVLPGYYHIVSQLGLIDHHASIVLVRGGGILFAIWIMKAAIETVPRELELSAILDGYSPGRVMLMVTMRLAFPGITAAFLLEFVSAWNGYLLPLLFLDNPRRETVALGIDRFLSSNALDLGPTMTYAILVSIPLLIVIPRLLVGALSPYRHRLPGGN